MRRRSLALIFVAFSGLAVTMASGQPGSSTPPAGKTAVKTAADLPVHTYAIEGKASELLLSDQPFKAFVAKLKADLESDLAAYDIQDKSTLQQYYSVLQGIAVIEGRLDDVQPLTEKIRAIELKESKKLMAGQTLAAFIAAKKSGASAEALTTKFAAELKKNLAVLPWDTVREDITAAKGRAEMISRELILGQIKGGLDPVVEAAKGTLSGDLARAMVGARVTLDVMLPLQPAAAKVYADLIAANASEMKDRWTPTLVTLAEADKAKPVVVCIWDSGLDVAPFSGQLYVNAREQANGKDDDGNGFIDDINGIAFDLEAKPTPELLHSVKELKSGLALVESHTKGMMDLQANIDSAEASSLKKHVASLKADQVSPFIEDLGLYGGYSHGTHVAGIAAAGNPFVRLLACRLTFDHREIPLNAPSEAQSKQTAASYASAVAYMKAAGVRVVNMSWGGSFKDIEEALEKKGIGANPQERAQLAGNLFAIERDALEAAIKSAPDILFIAAAGNSNNNNEFVQFIPSGLNLPNLITVGAVDMAGKPTGFTTFGKNVRLYANGYEVESFVPGGKRMRFSGTSMAAPNVSNLAAKLIAISPQLTPQQTIAIMGKSATPMEGHPELSIINPKAAIGQVRGN